MWAGYLAVFAALVAGNPAAAVELDFGIVKTLEQLSLPVPDPANPIVCHGFGCAYRTPILLRNSDRAQIKKLFGAAAAKSPEGERKAVAAAMAWFEKRVAAEAGTAGAKARAGLGHAGDPSQFDCLDKTSNTIGLLSVIVQMGHVAQEIVIKTGSVIASKDVESAQTLDSDDDAMDELHRQLLSMLLDGPWKYGVQSAVDLTLIGRYYERYADWAVTVAHRVIYLVTGVWEEGITSIDHEEQEDDATD